MAVTGPPRTINFVVDRKELAEGDLVAYDPAIGAFKNGPLNEASIPPLPYLADPSPIEALSNVGGPIPTSGQVLTWNELFGRYQAADPTGGGGATTLDDLTDVDTSGSVEGSYIRLDNMATWITQTGIPDGDLSANVTLLGNAVLGSGSIVLATGETGTGDVVRDTGPVINEPSISSFVSANHGHTNVTTGGTLSAAAIASGVFDIARIPDLSSLYQVTPIGEGDLPVTVTLQGNAVIGTGSIVLGTGFTGTGLIVRQDGPTLAYLPDTAVLDDLTDVSVAGATEGKYLRMGLSEWEDSSLLAADLTGFVGVTHGGTGLVFWPPHSLLVGSGAGTAVVIIDPGAAGEFLKSAGAAAPSFEFLEVADIPALPYLADTAVLADLADVTGVTGTGQVLVTSQEPSIDGLDLTSFMFVNIGATIIYQRGTGIGTLDAETLGGIPKTWTLPNTTGTIVVTSGETGTGNIVRATAPTIDDLNITGSCDILGVDLVMKNSAGTTGDIIFQDSLLSGGESLTISLADSTGAGHLDASYQIKFPRQGPPAGSTQYMLARTGDDAQLAWVAVPV